MNRYTDEQLKEMAEIVMSKRGTEEYRLLTDLLCIFTELPLKEVVNRIERMLDKDPCNHTGG